jgi:hypothetical protein
MILSIMILSIMILSIILLSIMMLSMMTLITLNINIYYYLKSSGGQSSNLYLNVVHFFNTDVNKKTMAA